MKPHPALLALLLPTAAIAAPAAPTYLECSVEGGVPFQLTMDEANGVVTYYVPATGHSERLPAVFNANSVIAQTRRIGIVVGRVDLRVGRVLAALPKQELGTCRVMQAPKRVF